MKILIAYFLALVAALGLYPATARVVVLDQTNDAVTIETASGFRYQFRGVEDWTVGDFASAIVWDNGTECIDDDVIITVRYSGWSAAAGDPLN